MTWDDPDKEPGFLWEFEATVRHPSEHFLDDRMEIFVRGRVKAMDMETALERAKARFQEAVQLPPQIHLLRRATPPVWSVDD